MTGNIQLWIKRRPIAAFYIIAFAITWMGWVPQAAYSHGLFPFNSPILYIIGGMGPLAAALIVARVLYGNKDAEEVFKPLLCWKVNIVWYLVVLGGNAIIMLAAAGLSGKLSEGLERLTPSFGMLTVFLTYLVAAIPEEVAWRGFVLPRLQARYNALASSLIIGVIWALWHIPLLLIKGSVMASYSLAPYFLGIIAGSVIYTWIYNSCRGSVLILTLFHAVSNTLGPNFGFWQTAVELVIAVLLVLVFGYNHLAFRSERLAHDSGLGTKISLQ